MKIHISLSLLISLGLFNLSYAAPASKKVVSQSRPSSQAISNMKFWSGQYVEHAEFASDFTQDAALKKEGVNLAQRAKSFNKNVSSNANAQKEFDALSKEMKKYQSRVRAVVKKQPKSQNKDIYLDLLDHMDKETDYAQKKATGKTLSAKEEANFWSQEHEGEAKVMSALMNVNSSDNENEGLKLKQEADSIVKELKGNDRMWVSSRLEPVQEANAQLDAIAQELDQDPSLTRIPKKLAKHEERERKWAADIFAQLDQAA